MPDTDPEMWGNIPVKTEVTGLKAGLGPPAGFSVYVVPFDDKTPDYDATILQATEKADWYRGRHLVEYQEPDDTTHLDFEVLPFLKGRPWDQFSLNYVHSLRPSCIRVSKDGLTLDACPWRVTVTLEEDDRTIHQITQEVEVGCIGAQHGHGLSKYLAGQSPAPTNFIVNARALKKLEITK